MIFFEDKENKPKNCSICKEAKTVASALSVCKECLKNNYEESQIYVKQAHKIARTRLNLPVSAPIDGQNKCALCHHNCAIGKDDVSFCGLRYNKDGNFISMASKEIGVLDYYLDPLPCNCCAAWFCPAGTGAGYPEFAAKKGKEIGHHNLSIFFYGCSFNCLFCQNQNHKSVKMGSKVSTERLVEVYKQNKSITCVCFFGGSPEPQFNFAINLSEKILEVAKKENRLARICWEWNGFGNRNLVKKAAELSLISGGNIKFDLKAWNPYIHEALTGVNNEEVLKNFEFVGKEFFTQRQNLPVLNATTLLVPGYIDEDEVENIASFIASINEDIPYSLLGFYPHFWFSDMSLTSRKHAERCFNVAKKHLNHVNIGNKHLLV
ncbi:MAG: radical SAM protein [Candidatus Heimdallarchaeota archaeon]|nr:radical SAM protein [Candidatus Heimdallarchaeota archaeon]MCK4878284.1 radical SAM protein [Candidatus Heimdallarchaeota archaeon]